MRRHINIDDGAVLLGAAFLVFSVIGMYWNTAAPPKLRSLFGEQSGTPSQNLPVRVYEPFSTPAESPTATSTPFLPEPPTPTSAHRARGGTPGPVETGESSFLVPGTPQATRVPPTEALVPDRIVIPAIQLDARVVPAGYQLIQLGGQVFQQWDAPNEYSAGWQQTSARLGVPGNTVLNGHHNIYGMVFGRLIDLSEGDFIQMYSGSTLYNFVITNKMILPERGEPIAVRMDNARWLLPTNDERLTLITCWPQLSNTHRLIIVAKPVGLPTQEP
jgi:LPXTG-site transpeptidase (sortase) family protein